jgi:hypothetical protein
LRPINREIRHQWLNARRGSPDGGRLEAHLERLTRLETLVVAEPGVMP